MADIPGGGGGNVFEKEKERKRLISLTSCLITQQIASSFVFSHLPHTTHLSKCSLSEGPWRVSEGNTGHADTPLTSTHRACNEGLIWF